ncbi:hypothetical protein BGZ92_007636 [Podila epicladia]|nr:hypothetical protein BGZ92_007636 [Podila epicladia]
MMAVGDYTFLFALGMIFAFLDSYGIGANDVSNSFGAAVGSGALNLKQAVLIASVCEFLGAFLMGSETADTIKGGAITGAGIAGFGFNTVKWSGVGMIVLSWLISPIVAGLVTAFIFVFTRWLILQHQNSLHRGLTAIPFYFAVTIAINVFYIIFKGSPGLSLSSLPIGAIIGISFGIALVVFLWCNFFLKVYLRRKLENDEDLKCDSSDGTVNSGLAALDDTPKKLTMFQKLKAKATAGMNHNIKENSEAVDNIHDNSTKYDAKTEQLFCTLQVLTACFSSFAHGSNDVANAIGPLTTIYYVWKHAAVDITGTPVPAWILAYGGIAIDIGLLTYGYRVMATLGNNITFMSPSRGFSVSLGTSLTVLTCSKLGLPISSTHCITGSTAAVGLASGGGRKSINWKILAHIGSSWLMTLPAAGVVSGLIFAIIINSPHKM